MIQPGMLIEVEGSVRLQTLLMKSLVFLAAIETTIVQRKCLDLISLGSLNLE
jgi:hypothetical protein